MMLLAVCQPIMASAVVAGADATPGFLPTRGQVPYVSSPSYGAKILKPNTLCDRDKSHRRWIDSVHPRSAVDCVSAVQSFEDCKEKRFFAYAYGTGPTENSCQCMTETVNCTAAANQVDANPTQGSIDLYSITSSQASPAHHLLPPPASPPPSPLALAMGPVSSWMEEQRRCDVTACPQLALLAAVGVLAVMGLCACCVCLRCYTPRTSTHANTTTTDKAALHDQPEPPRHAAQAQATFFGAGPELFWTVAIPAARVHAARPP